MQLVGKQTMVPVPEVLIAWTDKRGQTHLVMERIRGGNLGLSGRITALRKRKPWQVS
jgi:hypothetical protein